MLFNRFLEKKNIYKYFMEQYLKKSLIENPKQYSKHSFKIFLMTKFYDFSIVIFGSRNVRKGKWKKRKSKKMNINILFFDISHFQRILHVETLR